MGPKHFSDDRTNGPPAWRLAFLKRLGLGADADDNSIMAAMCGYLSALDEGKARSKQQAASREIKAARADMARARARVEAPRLHDEIALQHEQGKQSRYPRAVILGSAIAAKAQLLHKESGRPLAECQLQLAKEFLDREKRMGRPGGYAEPTGDDTATGGDEKLAAKIEKALEAKYKITAAAAWEIVRRVEPALMGQRPPKIPASLQEKDMVASARADVLAREVADRA